MNTHDAQQIEHGQQQEPHGREGHEGHDIVTIYVDDKPVEIHRGHQSVAAIKAAASIPAAYVLVQVVDGRDEPLADDAYVTIKEGARFESHPREGGAS